MDHNGKAVRLLLAWQENYTRQTFISAALSCGCTALFALYHGYLGLRYWSLWHGSIGVFFLLLTAIRGSILVMEKRNSTKPEATRDRCRRWTFQISTALLLVLDLALAAPISMMALFAKPVYLGLNAATPKAKPPWPARPDGRRRSLRHAVFLHRIYHSLPAAFAS